MKALLLLVPLGLLTAGNEPPVINLTIVLPNGFKGFGAIYQSAHPPTEKIGRFEIAGNTRTAIVDRNGGVEVDSMYESLRNHNFRISVVSASGQKIPLQLSHRDPTDGTRFWLLPMPASRALYFFVGTDAEVTAFLKHTEAIYEVHFSIDDYFRERR